MKTMQRLRRAVPGSAAGLAGLACAACCLIPALLGTGVIAGVGWTALGRILPSIAIALAAVAGLTWWWTNRRRRHVDGCSCGTSTT